MKKKHRAPERVELTAEAYDNLRKLIEWYQATPGYIDLGDDVEDYVRQMFCDYLDPVLPPNFYVASVQIETPDTVWRNTYVGALVALVESDRSIEAGEECEQHVLVTRGLPAKKPAKKVTKRKHK